MVKKARIRLPTTAPHGRASDVTGGVAGVGVGGLHFRAIAASFLAATLARNNTEEGRMVTLDARGSIINAKRSIIHARFCQKKGTYLIVQRFIDSNGEFAMSIYGGSAGRQAIAARQLQHEGEFQSRKAADLAKSEERLSEICQKLRKCYRAGWDQSE